MEILAPAKVNLGLSVLGKLESGYHSLHTLFAALELGDRLEVSAIPEGLELEVKGSDLPADTDNLIYKAALAYLNAAAWPGGCKVVLHKQLPLAAGLGGGSSDAAAVLKALTQLYPAPLDLPSIALRLGADVPFFLGFPLAEGRGVGEVLNPLPPAAGHLVLLNPGIAVAAATAYRNLEARDYQAELDPKAILEAVAAGETPPYWNTLEKPVLALEPAIGEAKAILQKAGLKGVLMSGSGSTVFGLAQGAEQAQWIASRLAQQYPRFWIRATALRTSI